MSIEAAFTRSPQLVTRRLSLREVRSEDAQGAVRDQVRPGGDPALWAGTPPLAG